MKPHEVRIQLSGDPADVDAIADLIRPVLNMISESDNLENQRKDRGSVRRYLHVRPPSVTPRTRRRVREEDVPERDIAADVAQMEARMEQRLKKFRH